MIKNNIEIDVKVKCIEKCTTQTKLAEDIGTSKSYISRIIKKPENVINKTYPYEFHSIIFTDAIKNMSVFL